MFCVGGGGEVVVLREVPGAPHACPAQALALLARSSMPGAASPPFVHPCPSLGIGVRRGVPSTLFPASAGDGGTQPPPGRFHALITITTSSPRRVCDHRRHLLMRNPASCV